jgi:hypothetical protein
LSPAQAESVLQRQVEEKLKNEELGRERRETNLMSLEESHSQKIPRSKGLTRKEYSKAELEKEWAERAEFAKRNAEEQLKTEADAIYQAQTVAAGKEMGTYVEGENKEAKEVNVTELSEYETNALVSPIKEKYPTLEELERLICAINGIDSLSKETEVVTKKLQIMDNLVPTIVGPAGFVRWKGITTKTTAPMRERVYKAVMYYVMKRPNILWDNDSGYLYNSINNNLFRFD